MKVTEVYTVEYSVIQYAYHIDTLDKILRINNEAVVKALNNGYLLLGIFKNYDAASDFVRYHREFMERLNTNTMPLPGDMYVNQLGELDIEP